MSRLLLRAAPVDVAAPLDHNKEYPIVKSITDYIDEWQIHKGVRLLHNFFGSRTS